MRDCMRAMLWRMRVTSTRAAGVFRLSRGTRACIVSGLWRTARMCQQEVSRRWGRWRLRDPHDTRAMRRSLLSFVLLLCVAYAASTSAYADEAADYWAQQAMQAPESSSPVALCVSALAMTALLFLRLAGARRRDFPEFDSETLVLSREQLRARRPDLKPARRARR